MQDILSAAVSTCIIETLLSVAVQYAAIACHIACILKFLLVHALQLDDLERHVGTGFDHLQNTSLQNMSYLTCETGYQFLIESARVEIGQEKVCRICAALAVSFFVPGANSRVAGILTGPAHDLDGCMPRQVTCQEFSVVEKNFALFVQEIKVRGLTLFRDPRYGYASTTTAFMKPLER